MHDTESKADCPRGKTRRMYYGRGASPFGWNENRSSVCFVVCRVQIGTVAENVVPTETCKISTSALDTLDWASLCRHSVAACFLKRRPPEFPV